MTWLMVIGFGIVGISLRYGIDTWVAKWSWEFPYGTLFINILGCLIAGCIFTLGTSKDSSFSSVYLAMIAGFCGGFTTFSGFGLQFLQLLNSGKTVAAFTYGVASPVLCILATGIGFLIAKMF